MTQVATSPQAIDSEQADAVLELCALKKLSATKFLTYIALKLIWSCTTKSIMWKQLRIATYSMTGC